AAISSLLFFIIYISRTVFIGNTSFGGPDELKIYYTIFLIFHITLATIGAIFGIVTLVLAFKRKITVHRKIVPITSVIWFFIAGTGIMVYLLLYILYEGAETTSVIKAILGTLLSIVMDVLRIIINLSIKKCYCFIMSPLYFICVIDYIYIFFHLITPVSFTELNAITRSGTIINPNTPNRFKPKNIASKVANGDR